MVSYRYVFPGRKLTFTNAYTGEIERSSSNRVTMRITLKIPMVCLAICLKCKWFVKYGKSIK